MESNAKIKKDIDFSKNEGGNPPKRYILHSIINKASNCSKTTFDKTGKFLESVLSSNKDLLKELCVQGLPDDLLVLRSLIWKINLGYLPINSDSWESTLEQKRKTYTYYKTLFKKKLEDEFSLFENYDNKSKEEKLKLDETTNKKLLEDITKDINRTHQNFSFFFQTIEKNNSLSEKELKSQVENRRNCTLKNISDTYKVNINETHADVLARILFIFSQFAPDVSYVQGMNEIIAPIYYSFSFDTAFEENYSNIEADCFWSFYFLMQEIKCVFIQEDDHTQSGLYGKAEKLKLMLKIIDNQLYEHFEKYNLDYSFFACRWFILFFAQDFLMIDIFRLWDYIFSEEDKFKNVFYLGLAILRIKREKLLIQDLGGMIGILQDISDIDIEILINNSLDIKNKFGKKVEELL